jgi:hypothetical protein
MKRIRQSRPEFFGEKGHLPSRCQQLTDTGPPRFQLLLRVLAIAAF